MTKLEIEKVLVVSTAHITEADNDILHELVIYCNAKNFEFPLANSFHIPLADFVFDSKFSPAFKKLYEFAKTHEENFTHLKLDGHWGPLIDGFETFEW